MLTGGSKRHHFLDAKFGCSDHTAKRTTAAAQLLQNETWQRDKSRRKSRVAGFASHVE
jgi:hypothetical protein